MFKKIWIYPVFLCLNITAFSQSRITYNAYFDYNRGYCEGDSQYDHWVDFLNQLDTLSDRYTRITISGTYDITGKSCSDKYAVRQIADALANRYDATVYCDGNYWSVGNGCSDFNCGGPEGYVELSLNSTCNCGFSYTIRPGITSPNWGGVATETCQSFAQNASQEMRVDIEKLNGNDNLALKSLTAFDECESVQEISALVANNGLNLVSDYMIGFSINGVLQVPVSVSQDIGPGAIDKILLRSSFTFSAGTVYDFKIWTYDPNNQLDSQPDNDTFSITYMHTGYPQLPLTSGLTACGAGAVVLTASSVDSIAWYAAATGGVPLATGPVFKIPFLHSTDTFYAETFRIRQGSSGFGTGFNNYTTLSEDPSEYNGGMLKLSVNDMLNISGIRVQSLFGNPSPHYKVYLRENGYEGAVTDSTGWKRVFDARLSNAGLYNTIPVHIVLRPGIDYGIYITSDPESGEDAWLNTGNSTFSNDDISVSGGTAVYGKFGSVGVYERWTMDAEFIYEKSCHSPGRRAAQVVILSRPYGAKLEPSQSSVFYRSGTQEDPDIAEPGLIMKYNITDPAGYHHSEHGTIWEIDSISVIGNGNRPVNPSKYKLDFPDATSLGRFSFLPDSSLVDSTITVRIHYKDIVSSFCDTVITRVIHVAPVPVPAFSVQATICEGSEIYFKNLSRIHSGRMSYQWFFSATDSSEIFEPVYQFDSFGIYPVRLRVTSIPYGISRDTVMMVNVHDRPHAGFSVRNACEGRAIAFTNLTSGGASLVNYKWDFGDHTPLSSLNSPDHLYYSSGIYNVTLRADLNGCISTVTKRAYMFPRPEASFSGPSGPVCRNEPVSFTNYSTIANGNMGAFWDFADSTYATLFNVSHYFSAAHPYTVKLKMVSEFGCEDSAVQTVMIKPVSETNFMANRLCSLDPTHFTNLSTEFPGISSTYIWTFSEGLPQNSRHATKFWTSHGPKTVALKTALSNGCISRLERLIDIEIQPRAAFNVSNICSEETADFVNMSRIEQGEVHYYWDFGDQGSSNLFHTQHTYQVDTTTWFKAVLIADAEAGCSDTAETMVRVYELPTCNFTYKPFLAIGNRTFVFMPEDKSSTEYEWFFGEGGNSKNISPIYQFLYSGNYDVRLRAKNAGGCICEQLIRVNIEMSGIGDVQQLRFDLYPNPANASVNIVLQGAPGTAHIYNDLGQRITTIPVDQAAVLPTASFKEGLYLIEILTADGKKSTARFSVIH